jgi:hypothetical protein
VPKSGLWKAFSGAPTAAFAAVGYLRRCGLLASEYLALEREAPVKHELLEGFPHAMAGASDRHNRVVVNLVLALGPLAREKGRVEVRSRSGRSFTLP